MVRSCSGFSVLNASLSESGSTASLTSGMPNRDTCTGSPLMLWRPSPEITPSRPLSTCMDGRREVAQTPSTGSSPWVRRAMGTSTTNVCTLKPDSESTGMLLPSL